MKELELPKSWEEAPLGDLCNISTGDKDVNEGDPSGDYPFFTCAKEISRFSSFSFAGDVLLIAGNGNFDVKKYSGKFEVYQRTYVLQNFQINYQYLYYYVLFNLRSITEDHRGSTIRYIRIGDLTDYIVRFPSIVQQRRIVAKIEGLFSELDKGIESLKAARAKLNVYRQAVLKHAFEGKLTAQWREENKDKLETPEQLLARIKQEREARHEQQFQKWKAAVKEWEAEGKPGKKPSKPRKAADLLPLDSDALAKLPPLPEGYAYTYLANLGELGRGKSKHRPRNAPKLFGGPYPFIQTGEVKAAGRIIREYSQTYSELGLEQSKLWPEGTLCITIAANIAETAFLGFDGCFPDSIVGFTAAKTLVLPEYVELFIKSVRTRLKRTHRQQRKRTST